MSSDYLFKNLGINLVASVNKIISAISLKLDISPSDIDTKEPLVPPSQEQVEIVGETFEKAGKILTPFADAVSGLLHPGGFSRFIYILYNSELKPDEFVVIGQTDKTNYGFFERKFINFFTSQFGKISMAISTILDPIFTLVKDIPYLIQSAGNAFISMVNSIGSIIQGVKDILHGNIRAGGNAFYNAFTEFGRIIKVVFNQFKDTITKILKTIQISFYRLADVIFTGNLWGFGDRIINWLLPIPNKKKEITKKILQYFETNIKGIPKYYQEKKSGGYFFGIDVSRTYRFYGILKGNLWYDPWSLFNQHMTELGFIPDELRALLKDNHEHPDLNKLIQDWDDEDRKPIDNEAAARYRFSILSKNDM
jgi:hypothetical protein